MEPWVRKIARASAVVSMWVSTEAILWLHLRPPSKLHLSASSQSQQMAQAKILWVIFNTCHSFILLSWYQSTRNSVLSFKICTQSLTTLFIFFTSLGLSTNISPRLLWQPPGCPPLCFLDPYRLFQHSSQSDLLKHKTDHITPLSPPSKSSPSQSCGQINYYIFNDTSLRLFIYIWVDS